MPVQRATFTRPILAAAMVAIDYTPEVACEAAGAKCDCVIAYHPPIFEALKRITANSVIFDAIRDRLEHSALTVNITGDTYRGVKARKLASKKKDA